MKDFIECKICNKKLKTIRGGKFSNLNIHGISLKRYFDMFHNAEITSESCREKHRILGDNMPRETIMKMVKGHMNDKSKLKRTATWRERGYDKKLSRRPIKGRLLSQAYDTQGPAKQ